VAEAEVATKHVDKGRWPRLRLWLWDAGFDPRPKTSEFSLPDPDGYCVSIGAMIAT
jgi:hypothetical protein